MPLLLFDLDNTLLPRDAAYRAWAQDFLAEHRLPAGDIDWFTTIDGSGYVPRSTVLGAAKRRYGLDHSMDLLLAHYRRGINTHIHCPDTHIDALQAARASGWTLGIVSNGGTKPQLEKIRRTGLGALVDGWVISEEARCVKPDPLIFEIGARRCGVPLTPGWENSTWMVGDHGPADIAGAEVAGLRSVWLHLGRPWAEQGYRPTLSAAGLPEAVGLVLSARNAPTAATVHRGAVRRAVAQQASARRAAAEHLAASDHRTIAEHRAARLPGVGAGLPRATAEVAASGTAQQLPMEVVPVRPAAAARAASVAAVASAAQLSPISAPASRQPGVAQTGSLPTGSLQTGSRSAVAAEIGRTRFAAPSAAALRGATAGYTVIDDGVAG